MCTFTSVCVGAGQRLGVCTENFYRNHRYCEHDLACLAETMPQPFSQSEVKRILMQLLSAVQYLHSHWIIHRDLKMSNLLYNNKGELKLADFGLAREYGEPIKPLTPKVVTLWYRAPELLLGVAQYTTAIDLWGVGCIFGELLLHKPLMPGKTDTDQLQRIFKLLGAASERIWPGMKDLPYAAKLTFDTSKYVYNELHSTFPQLSPKGIRLMNDFFTYDPTKRVTAEEALESGYFLEAPHPQEEGMMPTFPTEHTNEGYRGPHRLPAKTKTKPQAQATIACGSGASAFGELGCRGTPGLGVATLATKRLGNAFGSAARCKKQKKAAEAT